MAGPGELNSARLRRDLSLALRRRLTIAAGVGAAGLTVVFSLIAATTAPGRTTPDSTTPTQPDPTSNRTAATANRQPTQLPAAEFSAAVATSTERIRRIPRRHLRRLLTSEGKNPREGKETATRSTASRDESRQGCRHSESRPSAARTVHRPSPHTQAHRRLQRPPSPQSRAAPPSCAACSRGRPPIHQQAHAAARTSPHQMELRSRRRSCRARAQAAH